MDLLDPVFDANGSRRDSFGSETGSPGTSIVRDSFLSTDSPPPLTTPGLFFDFPDNGLRIDSLLPAASDNSECGGGRLHPPLAITNYWADSAAAATGNWAAEAAQSQRMSARAGQPELRH